MQISCLKLSKHPRCQKDTCWHRAGLAVGAGERMQQGWCRALAGATDERVQLRCRLDDAGPGPDHNRRSPARPEVPEAPGSQFCAAAGLSKREPGLSEVDRRLKIILTVSARNRPIVLPTARHPRWAARERRMTIPSLFFLGGTSPGQALSRRARPHTSWARVRPTSREPARAGFSPTPCPCAGGYQERRTRHDVGVCGLPGTSAW